MTDIKLFENPEFGQVRIVIQENNEPLFCLADVCKILGLTNTSVVKEQIIREFGDDLSLTYPILDSIGRKQEVTFVKESHLYFIMMRSDKPNAKGFRLWVTEDVLPSIRKTGLYTIKPMTTIEMLAVQAQAMVELERKQREQEVKQREHELRLNVTESKVNELVSIQEENLKHLNTLSLAEEEIIQMTPRQELNQMVRTYAQSAGIKYNEVWNKIYSELYYHYHISINAYKKEKGENNLDIAEKIGAIDKLKVIVSSLIKEIGKVRPLVKK